MQIVNGIDVSMNTKWKRFPEEEPDKYEEVNICTDDGKVKSATYIGNYKWNTYCKVVLWQPLPEVPIELLKKMEIDLPKSEPKLKRGRRKV